MTSSNFLFCPTKSPKVKYIQFAIIYNSNILNNFLLINSSNNRQTFWDYVEVSYSFLMCTRVLYAILQEYYLRVSDYLFNYGSVFKVTFKFPQLVNHNLNLKKKIKKPLRLADPGPFCEKISINLKLRWP